jgi:hypothetical protein
MNSSNDPKRDKEVRQRIALLPPARGLTKMECNKWSAFFIDLCRRCVDRTEVLALS